MVNKYPGACVDCGNTVQAGHGKAFKSGKRWAVAHTDCASAPTEKPLTYKQQYGRCEDAPCCGCCGNGQEYYSDYNNYSDPF